MQDVLNNPEYDALYERYDRGEIKEYSGTFDSGVNLMEAIPYAFLENTNENVEGIKNGTVAVGSDLYVRQDEKDYIYNRLEIIYEVDNGDNYINQYLLKYQIKEDELEDLKMLYKGRYYQGPVMFQYLASQRQPEVIAECSVLNSSYKRLLSYLNSDEYIKENFGETIENYIITYFDKNNEDPNNYDVEINIVSGNYQNVSKQKMASLSFKLHQWALPQIKNNIISWNQINGRVLNPQISASTTITYFQLAINFENFKKYI